MKIISSSSKPAIFLASTDSVLQKTLPKKILMKKMIHLSRGQEGDMEKIKTQLQELGYSRESSVYTPGEYAIRGGIIDVFPAGLDFPVRLEFFGNILDS